jgi:hypothetical protein
MGQITTINQRQIFVTIQWAAEVSRRYLAPNRRIGDRFSRTWGTGGSGRARRRRTGSTRVHRSPCRARRPGGRRACSGAPWGCRRRCRAGTCRRPSRGSRSACRRPASSRGSRSGGRRGTGTPPPPPRPNRWPPGRPGQKRGQPSSCR